MPQVPNQTGFSVGLQGGSNIRIPDSVAQNPGARQLAEAGAAITNAGAEAANLVRDAQARANDIRVTDALNSLKERALDLSYGPEEGFTNIKGGDALTRPGGKSLFDEYGEKLDETVRSSVEGLANDEQRRLFNQGASQIRQSYDGALMQHFNAEARTFELSTNTGVIATAQREIALSAGDPKAVASAEERIKRATADSFNLLGKSAVEADEQSRKFVSEGHTLAIGRMFEQNQTSSARVYLEAHKDAMEPEDFIRAEAKLTDLTRIADVTNFVGDMLSANGPAGASTDFDKLQGAVMQAEGGGTLDRPNVSPKGARGPMQVMPGTNLDPGYGVKPAQDNSEAERARVGRDYLAAMVKKYGTRLGVAAYNGGPGRVDAAIAKAKETGGDPLSYMPRETQAYTDRVMKSAGSQTAGDPKVSLSAGLSIIRERFKNDPEAMAEAERQFTSGYNAMLADKGRNEEDAVNGAMRDIYNNGGQVTPGIAARVPGKYLDNLNSFAANVRAAKSSGVDPGSSLLVWGQAKAGIANGSITSQDQLLRLAPGLTNQDYRDLVGDLAAVTAGDRKKIDSYSTMKQTLDFIHGEMAAAGVDWTPNPDGKSKNVKGAENYSRFSAQLFKQIESLEAIRGKPLEPDEARQVALKLLEQAHIPQGSSYAKGTRGYELANPAIPLSAIPADVRNYLSQRLRDARMPVTDDNIRWALTQIGPRR